MDERLAYGHAAQPMGLLVVLEAEPMDGLLGEAPRLAAVKQHCQHASLVDLALEALGHVFRAEEMFLMCLITIINVIEVLDYPA